MEYSYTDLTDLAIFRRFRWGVACQDIDRLFSATFVSALVWIKNRCTHGRWQRCYDRHSVRAPMGRTIIGGLLTSTLLSLIAVEKEFAS